MSRGKKPEKTEREWDREEQWAIQQDLLRKRKSGEMIDEADERRRKVAVSATSQSGHPVSHLVAFVDARFAGDLIEVQQHLQISNRLEHTARD